eukprot:9470912-Pyramimonas_sp.AAC.1
MGVVSLPPQAFNEPPLPAPSCHPHLCARPPLHATSPAGLTGAGMNQQGSQVLGGPSMWHPWRRRRTTDLALPSFSRGVRPLPYPPSSHPLSSFLWPLVPETPGP